MTEHTPEPWETTESGLVVSNVGTVADCDQSPLVATDNANATRICQCVNALAGKDPDKLEGALKAADDLCVSLRAQQDIFKQIVCNMVAMATNDLLDALAALEAKP